MICPKCGHMNNNNSVFCESCGKRLRGGQKPPSKDYKTLIMVAGVLSAVLIAGGILFFLMSSRANNEDEYMVQNDETKTEDITETEGKTETEISTTETDDSKDDDVVKPSIPDNVDIPLGAVTFQGHSYYIFENNCRTWEEAQQYCKSRGGYLAVIGSKEEDDFLYYYMIDSGRNEVYFGLSDVNLDGNWSWVDKKSSNYQNWGINDDGEIEPNKAKDDERYAEYDASLISGRWNDCGFGRDTSAYICEWDYSRP